MPQIKQTVNCGQNNPEQMMNASAHKVILVTGAAGGLGSALSKIAASRGWRAILVDVNRRGLEKLYDEIVADGGLEPIIHPMDLALIGTEDCEQLAGAINEQEGRLDAFVHCAVAFKGLQPLDLIEPLDWLREMQVNVNAPWLLSTHCLALLKKSRQSRLVFVYDGQSESRALWGAYGVSKAAVRALAAQFRSELQSTPVSVYAVDPGAMRTALRASVFHSEDPSTVSSADDKANTLFAVLESAGLEHEFLVRL